MRHDVHVLRLQEGGSTTDQAKGSAEALKEKTKNIAGQAAEGLKNAAGESNFNKLDCHSCSCVVLPLHAYSRMLSAGSGCAEEAPYDCSDISPLMHCM